MFLPLEKDLQPQIFPNSKGHFSDFKPEAYVQSSKILFLEE